MFKPNPCWCNPLSRFPLSVLRWKMKSINQREQFGARVEKCSKYIFLAIKDTVPKMYSILSNFRFLNNVYCFISLLLQHLRSVITILSLNYRNKTEVPWVHGKPPSGHWSYLVTSLQRSLICHSNKRTKLRIHSLLTPVNIVHLA